MTADSVDVTAIVLNYNGLRFLDRCLQSLRNQTLQYLRILVVDNGSTDGSVAHVRSNHPDIDLVETGVNLGYAGGNNLGASHATSPFLFFLNNDAVPEPDAIERLSDHMQANDRVAACQPKIRNLVHPERFDYAGGSAGTSTFSATRFAGVGLERSSRTMWDNMTTIGRFFGPVGQL